jgi:hypothetical protein
MIYSLYRGFDEELYHLEAYEITDVIKRTPIGVKELEEGAIPAPAPASR